MGVELGVFGSGLNVFGSELGVFGSGLGVFGSGLGVFWIGALHGSSAKIRRLSVAGHEPRPCLSYNLDGL